MTNSWKIVYQESILNGRARTRNVAYIVLEDTGNALGIALGVGIEARFVGNFATERSHALAGCSSECLIVRPLGVQDGHAPFALSDDQLSQCLAQGLGRRRKPIPGMRA